MVGRNFVYQNESGYRVFFDKEVHTNPFVGTGGGGVAFDDFNADAFDHGPLGFVGGSPVWCTQAGTKAINGALGGGPPGTPKWGSKWKKGLQDTYLHTMSFKEIAATATPIPVLPLGTRATSPSSFASIDLSSAARHHTLASDANSRRRILPSKCSLVRAKGRSNSNSRSTYAAHNGDAKSLDCERLLIHATKSRRELYRLEPLEPAV